MKSRFGMLKNFVLPHRKRKDENGTFQVRAVSERENWWRFARSRRKMRQHLAPLKRLLVTPMVSSTRVFCFLSKEYLSDQKLVSFAFEDDTRFGILQSIIHETWTLKTCSWIGKGNDPTYANQKVFETFPFPESLTPNISAAAYADDQRAQAIAAAAARLNVLRENWLNPPDLVKRVPEVVPGYPDRILPVDDAAAAILKKRTLTNLYNERPAWLDNAHRDLDAAVAAAYGWTDWEGGLPDEEILERLFKLNQERAATGR
jgi:type II restriction/modification system DNA methylase subunit YeeA